MHDIINIIMLLCSYVYVVLLINVLKRDQTKWLGLCTVHLNGYASVQRKEILKYSNQADVISNNHYKHVLILLHM